MRPLFTRSLRWAFSAGGTLRERGLRGGFWLLLGDAAAGLSGALKLAILARLLAPGEFGLMGVAMVVLRWLDYFTEPGLRFALIQKAGDIRPYLDTVFTAQLVRGVALALTLVLAAPFAGWFFENPEVIPVVRAVALVMLLRGLINPAVVRLRKELDFRKDVIWRMSGVVAGLVVAVPAALVYRDISALVLSVVAAQAAETLASYWIQRYRPRLRLDWAQARELMVFGKWIFWSNAVAFFLLYVDSLTVGKVLGTAALGFYQMAQQLAFMPTAQIGTHVHGVLFPAFSKLQGTAVLRRAFLKSAAVVSAVVIPAACILTAFADPLIGLGIGDKWLPIVPAFRLLVWAGVAAALGRVTTAALQALGRPDVPVGASFAGVLVLTGLLYPLVTPFGITGAATAAMAAMWVTLGGQALILVRIPRPIGGIEVLDVFSRAAV